MGEVRKRTIRSKISWIMIVVSITALLLSVVVSYLGMIETKDKSITSSNKLGDTAASDTRTALINQAKGNLLEGVKSKVEICNEKLLKMTSDVGLIANYMTDIYSNKEKYGSYFVDIPRLENNGVPSLQFSHVAGVTYEDVKEEVEKAASAYQIFEPLFKEDSDIISSIYFGSPSGFMLSYDKNSGVVYEEETEDPSSLGNYVITSRDWYIKAVDKGEATLVDTYLDVFDRLVVSCSAPVYDKDKSVAGVVSMDFLVDDIYDTISSIKFGDNGYAMLVNNQTGLVIASPNLSNENAKENNEYFRNYGNEFDSILQDMQNKKTDVKEVVMSGEEMFLAHTNTYISAWSLVIVLPRSEVVQPADLSYANIIKETDNTAKDIQVILKTMGFVFAIAFILIVFAVFLLTYSFSNKIAAPIKKLTNDVKIISEGNLEYKAEINTGDEIELLGNAFNSMTGSLVEYMKNLEVVTADKERIATELNVATTIQASMLPEGKSTSESCYLYADMHPAKEVGGDFYDYYTTEDNKQWFVMADVSGKGVPAALFMVIAKTLIKNQSKQSSSPAKVLEIVNNELCEHNEAGMFVTAFIAKYDKKTNTLEYANAGHNLPLIYRKNKEYTWLNAKPCFVLAGMENMIYQDMSIEFNEGDKLFLYTDGVTEALNTKEELYSDERLINKLNDDKCKKLNDVEDIVKYIQEDIKEFADGAEQADDITIMVFEAK